MNVYKIQSTYTYTLTQFIEANNINQAQEEIDQFNSQLNFGDFEKLESFDTLELIKQTIESQNENNKCKIY